MLENTNGPKRTHNLLKELAKEGLDTQSAHGQIASTCVIRSAAGARRVAEDLDPALMQQLRTQISIVNRRLGLTVIGPAFGPSDGGDLLHGRVAARLNMASLLIAANAAAKEEFGALRMSNPGLDMLLDLFLKQHAKISISLTSLGLASRASQSTGLRWIHLLEQQRFLVRKLDPRDARRWIIELTDVGLGKVEAFLDGLLPSDRE